MIKQKTFGLLVSVILGVMTLASCKISNKDAAEASRLGKVPEAAQYIVGLEIYAIPADGAEMFGPQSYHLQDYCFFFNNIKQNVADRIKAYMEK